MTAVTKEESDCAPICYCTRCGRLSRVVARDGRWLCFSCAENDGAVAKAKAKKEQKP